MMGLPPNYTAVGSVEGQLVMISNIDRLKALGGGIDTRQIAPIVAGLRDLHSDSPHLHVKPHTGWHVKNMAKWLTEGPLQIDDPTASQWNSDDAMFGADDLIRCAIQGFPLR